jgi:hypothetical protein
MRGGVVCLWTYSGGERDKATPRLTYNAMLVSSHSAQRGRSVETTTTGNTPRLHPTRRGWVHSQREAFLQSFHAHYTYKEADSQEWW